MAPEDPATDGKGKEGGEGQTSNKGGAGVTRGSYGRLDCRRSKDSDSS